MGNKQDNVTQNLNESNIKTPLQINESNIVETIQNVKRIEINKESMIKFNIHEKHRWILILSFVGNEDLSNIARVCKNFFFILKEEDKYDCNNCYYRNNHKIKVSYS